MHGVDWIAAEWTGRTLNLWAMGRAGALAHVQASSFEALQSLRAEWSGPNPVPVLAAGFDELGPAAPVPCPPLAAGLIADLRPWLWHVAGLSQSNPSDRVNGSEALRIAGVLAALPSFDGVLCLTGARSLWARISAGEVVSVCSALSGEVYSCLSQHAPQFPQPPEADTDLTSFDLALSETLSRPERLARALSQAMIRPRAQAQGQVLGALIGAELAAARPWWLGQDLLVMGEHQALYSRALAAQGVSVTPGDAQQALLAGFAGAFANLPQPLP
jgi:2-dehydro-3-deoxygalactonokinase